jgi:drug/metabolite transporter (DMT)-like permease
MSKKLIGSATVLALTAALFSGTNNFLTKIAVTAVKNPIVYTTFKNALVAAGLIGIVLALGKWREIRSLNSKQFLKLFAIGAVGGSVPFALYFTGLTMTSAINASLIHSTLFLWVLLLAIPILKERLSLWQWLGIAAIFAANTFIGGFSGFKFNVGELMILAATVLWAVENIIAKMALRDISSTTVAAARMFIGSVLLGAYLLVSGSGVPLFNLNATQWGWTLLTSALLLGYVAAWYAALKRAPATYVATLLVPATLVTNVLSAVFITRSFALGDLLNALLYATGTVLVIIFMKKAAPKGVNAPALNAAQ